MKHPIIDQQAIDSVVEILHSGELSMFRGTPEGHNGGVWVQRLEQSFRDYFGVQYAIAIQSATAGLHASLLALDIGNRDEVIVSPYTFVASASCVLMVGAKPVFVDIEPNFFCIDPKQVRKSITSRTRAIIPVHLMGQPADMRWLQTISDDYGLAIIEDSAQALGARHFRHLVGTMGDVGIFSFNQSKPVSSGEGGMVITNDDALNRNLRALRNYGEVSDPELKMVGYNWRLCEIEACLAYYQFQKIDEMNKHRQNLVQAFSEVIKGTALSVAPIRPGCSHVYYTTGIFFDKEKAGMTREEFQKRTLERGVYMGSGYVKPLYLLPVFGGKRGMCPVAERMYESDLLVTDIFRYPMSLERAVGIGSICKEVLNG